MSKNILIGLIDEIQKQSIFLEFNGKFFYNE